MGKPKYIDVKTTEPCSMKRLSFIQWINWIKNNRLAYQIGFYDYQAGQIIINYVPHER